MVKERNVRKCVLTAVFVVALLCATAAADVIYVDADATGGDGTTWPAAYKYLQDALHKPPSYGDEIWVAEGTYAPDANSLVPDGSGDREATFQLINGVGLYGGFAGGESTLDERDWENNETILSGEINTAANTDNSYHVVTGSGTDPNAILDGFTVTAGNANGSGTQRFGGGMYNDHSSATLRNCTFSGNSAFFDGGGMFNNNSSPTFVNCTFSGNSVFFNGGGMYNQRSNPMVTNCIFIGNSAGTRGGGIYFENSKFSIANSVGEFSGVQGQDNWYYGYYDGDGPLPYSTSDFEELPQYGPGPQLVTEWYISLSLYWTGVWAEGGHTNGLTTSGGRQPVEHWAVRRWVSEVTGPITITGTLAKIQDGAGDGVTGYILVDGEVVWSQYIAYNDTDGVNYSIDIDVNISSLVDFAISPNVSDWADGSRFTAIIEKIPDTSFPTLTNCTFSANGASSWGGGVCNRSGCNLTLTNCIVWGNTAPSGPQIYNDGTVTVTYCDVQGGYGGTGNIPDDPLFADADLRLSAGSLCIDAGDNAAVPADTTDLDGDGNTTEPIPFDLDGHARFVDDPNIPDTGNGTAPIVDMGAYERGFCGDADHPYPMGDMNSDCEVDIADACILALAWLSEDGGIGWNPDCDINIPADGSINGLDFAIFGQHWQECTKPECD